MKVCTHNSGRYRVEAEVTYIEDQGSWELSVAVFCDCGEQFSFLGLPVGIDMARPTTDPFRDRADLPIIPGVRLRASRRQTVPVVVPSGEPNA